MYHNNNNDSFHGIMHKFLCTLMMRDYFQKVSVRKSNIPYMPV